MTSTYAPPSFGPVTVHAPYRRRRIALAVVVLMLAAATVFVARYLLDDSRREYLATDGWPSVGQGAYQLGAEQPRASAHQQPVPIASLAKVMTAYLVLEQLPLHDGQDGPVFTVSCSRRRRHRCAGGPATSRSWRCAPASG